LGLGIVVGASLVKLPQILAITKSRSAEGLSNVAYELEEIGLAVMSANGFVMGLPFSAFGEAVFLLLQNTLLIGQIYYYSKTPVTRGLAGATALAAWFSAVALGECVLHPSAEAMTVQEGGQGFVFIPNVHQALFNMHVHHTMFITYTNIDKTSDGASLMFTIFVCTGQVDRKMMVRLLDLVTVIFLSARLPQIYQNFKVSITDPKPHSEFTFQKLSLHSHPRNSSCIPAGTSTC
jgi:uncharacterized protein with PQ loop repeat